MVNKTNVKPLDAHTLRTKGWKLLRPVRKLSLRRDQVCKFRLLAVELMPELKDCAEWKKTEKPTYIRRWTAEPAPRHVVSRRGLDSEPEPEPTLDPKYASMPGFRGKLKKMLIFAGQITQPDTVLVSRAQCFRSAIDTLYPDAT